MSLPFHQKMACFEWWAQTCSWLCNPSEHVGGSDICAFFQQNCLIFKDAFAQTPRPGSEVAVALQAVEDAEKLLDSRPSTPTCLPDDHDASNSESDDGKHEAVEDAEKLLDSRPSTPTCLPDDHDASKSESDDGKDVDPIRKLLEDTRARWGLWPIEMMAERPMSKAEIELRDLFAMQRMRRLSEESEVELFGPLHTVCESAAEDDDD